MKGKSEPQADFMVMVRAIWQSVSSMKHQFKLSGPEMQSLLGDMAQSTMRKGLLQQNVRVSRDVRDRVSLLLGIYVDLRVLFEDTQQATGWINRINTLPPFSGRCPRELMTSGDFMALASVRQFIGYWKG